MVRRITVSTRHQFMDSRGEGVQKDALDLGVKGITGVRVSDVYLFEGDITDENIQRITGELLTDFVTQEYSIDTMPEEKGHVIEVAYNHGVMDPVESSIYKSLKDMGITTVSAAKTMKRYVISGDVDRSDIELITDKLLVNKIIQHVTTPEEKIFLHVKPVEGVKRIEVELLGLSDGELENLSRDRFLSLNLEEMKTLQEYYRNLGRNPTDVELETFAQTWSEHCVHKTFRGIIDFNGEKIDNLLKQTIIKATREIDHEMCVSVFVDNAGVFRFDENDNICFKGEDVRIGDVVLEKGRRILPQHIALLASVGCVRPSVGLRPSVGIIPTGNELVPPAEKPGPGRIRESNSFQLSAQVSRVGAIPRRYGIAGDSEKAIGDALEKAASENDVVLFSGGVSMGDFDLVPGILKQSGVDILFEKIGIKPGKPTVFGRSPDAFWFGLPGNPVSAFVVFELLVGPFLRKMMGADREERDAFISLGETISRKKTDRDAWIPVELTDDGQVMPIEYHGSAHNRALCPADGLICVPSGVAEIPKGTLVSVRRI